ncbi:carboxypeptidase M32 [Bacillus sp. RG28]|uniref:Metal-dependent carboxypeptidase n=1 Tax=Gottfriedia endophytica TaxID=2820819 RepID=A0A940NMH2_9BACI|nr:carboxypeptidase M32 [Gottfriedia endophytica]MBP0724163.1 carboxypeptidase M32 [Gottfriedia endophytica]
MSFKEVEQSFLDYVRKIVNYNEANSVMYWDLRTGAPKNSVAQRSIVISEISSEIFKMTTSDVMAHYLTTLEEAIGNNIISFETEQTVKEMRRQYDRNTKIPAEEYREYIKLQTMAESVWSEAKNENDFKKYQPYLEQIIEYKKRFVEYLGYKECKYDTYLDQYEPGMTVKELDQVFQTVRERIVPLVQAIANTGKNFEKEEMTQFVSKQKQREICESLLETLQYNFSAGRLDETAHPFATSLNLGDVRVTTKFHENNFDKAIFSTIHECGHALYEQNISTGLAGLPICCGASLGIHESQSLFFEKMIGKSYAFWSKNYNRLQEQLEGKLDDVSLDDFYKAINHSKPSFIRIEADELTYPLHVMLRYEIEKELLEGTIEVKDLPEIWNEKMSEYIGIRPSNDQEGVLQDVHWSMGYFGYFPTYALGAMYAAQIKNSMVKDIPNFDELVAKNEFEEILQWLKANIHQHGQTKTPKVLLRDVTGEELNVQYYIDYLENKFSALYDLAEVEQ